MKIKAILWTYYKTKSKEFPIKIRVTYTVEGKTNIQYFPIDVSVKKDEWDAKSERVKGRVNATEINLKIIEQRNAIEKNVITTGKATTGKNNNFIWWFEEYYKSVKLKAGIYHQKKINTVLTRLKAFQNPIYLTDLNVGFLRNFENSMLKEKLNPNYIADTLARVRTVVNTVLKSGGMEYHMNPFLHYKVKYLKTEKERLPFSDIEKLEKANLIGKRALARDIYIFSFYNGGLRFGDICRFNKSNFQNGRLIYQMNKTKFNRNIKMNAKALEIIKSYNYQFPLKIDFKNIELSIDRVRSDMNKNLKLACESIGIQKVSMHTARHSIADYAVKKKLGTRELKGILGHQKTSTTEIYMKSFYQEESDEAMNKLFKK